MKLLIFNIRSLILLLVVFFCLDLSAQNLPADHLSIPINHPLVLNPAYAGSKDFTTIGFSSKGFTNSHYQILSAHTRMTAKSGQFSNFGLGGYTFLEQLDQSWKTGLVASGAYHYSLDKAKIHTISGGASLKGIFTIPKETAESAGDSSGTSFSPDMDLGLYYYGPNAFGGISVTSLFESSRQYNVYGGYKILLSRSQAIVLEPSLLFSVNDSSMSDALDQLTPYLKLYLQNFFIGTYIKSLDLIAVFCQYQFPRFYTGFFLEFPSKGYLNDDNIIFELTLGINLGRDNQKFRQHRHW